MRSEIRQSNVQKIYTGIVLRQYLAFDETFLFLDYNISCFVVFLYILFCLMVIFIGFYF